jgi:tetratricopeptide (TPR) repeat protein
MQQKSHFMLGNLMAKIGKCYSSLGKHEQALDWFENAAGVLNSFVNDHKNSALISISKLYPLGLLRNVAIELKNLGQAENSLQCYSQFLINFAPFMHQLMNEIADSYNEMALYHKNNAQQEKALKCYEETLTLRKKYNLKKNF